MIILIWIWFTLSMFAQGIFYQANNDNYKDGPNIREMFLISFLAIIWPITLLIIIPVVQWLQYRETKLEGAARDVSQTIERSPRSDLASCLASISTQNLKLFLKAVRKEIITANNKHIQAVRDELINRAAEKQLLR